MRYMLACAVLLTASAANGQGTFGGGTLDRMGGRSSPSDKAKLEATIKWASAGRVDPRAKEPVAVDGTGKYVFRSRADKQGEIARLQEELALLGVQVISVAKPKDNEVGRLPSGFTRYRVVQIISEKSAIIRAEELERRQSTNLRDFGGPRAVVAEWTFFLDAPTADLHEDQELRAIPGAWKVGTKREYETAIGAKSRIHVLTPVSSDEAIKGIKADPAARSKTQPPRKETR